MAIPDFIRLYRKPLDQCTHVYVAKFGSDANGGEEDETPFRTLGAAVARATDLIAAGVEGVRIDVLDGGTYLEPTELTIPENVHVTAPAATFIGTVLVSANASFILNRHYSPANNAKMAQHEGGSVGAAIYAVNISDGRGINGDITGSDNIRNVGGGGKNFFVRVGIMYVAENGIGIGDVSNGNAGHIHFLVPDLYLAGANAIGILGSAQGQGSSNIIGYSDHIIEIGDHAGTIGIQLDDAGAAVKISVLEIIADTAYNITAGDLYIICLRIVGTQTGAPANLIS